jgi:hypothetical protein
MQAIILHSIDDAENCLKKELFKKGMLFSTHSSVDIYLQEKFGIHCQCLSEFLSIAEIDTIKNHSAKRVDVLLEVLDEKIAPLINSYLDFNMNYFVPLYSYYGKYHYFNCAVFIKCMEVLIKKYTISSVHCYNLRLNGILDLQASISTLVSYFNSSISTEIIGSLPKHKTADENIRNFLDLSKLVIFNPAIAIKIMQARLQSHKRWKLDANKKNIFMQEPLYDLEFLRKYNNKYNFIINKNNGKINYVGRVVRQDQVDININSSDFDIGSVSHDPVDKVFLNHLEENFLRHLPEYAYYLRGLESLTAQVPLSLGIWGLPPVAGLTALIFEFLRSKNIEVIGSQHGCTYGESYAPWHFDSDFNRCDYFISYGFTETDLARLYPERQIHTRIVPAGSVVDMKNHAFKKPIDILFPITNAQSIFEGGMTRIPPDQLTARQVALLEYLNTLQHLTVYIKPFRFSNYKNCSVLPVLKRCKNLRVVSHLKLEEFLTKYQPRAVLIEYPSQPLFEILHLDAEIFLMDNPLRPYERQALEELIKRVYYAEDSETMISWLDLFVNGRLPKKRDNTFFNHYVYKENQEETIIRLIDTLLKGQNGIEL